MKPLDEKDFLKLLKKNAGVTKSNLSPKEITKRIEELKTEVKETRLHEKIAFLCDKIKYYPTWIKQTPSAVCNSVVNPIAKTIDGGVFVIFQFNGSTYTLAQADVSSMMPDGDCFSTRKYSLYDDDEKLLLSVHGHVDIDEFSSIYNFTDVDAYLPGEWIKDVSKLYDEVFAHQQKRIELHEQNVKKLDSEELKRNFGL
jgi:hypothetical protein